MSGLQVHAVTATVVLACDRCQARWESDVFKMKGWRAWTDRYDQAHEAWAAGWAIFAGRRTQRTYCPQHRPTVPMFQVWPRSER